MKKLKVGNAVLPIDLIANEREDFVSNYFTSEFPQLQRVKENTRAK